MQEVLSLPAALQDMCGGSRQDVIYMDEGVPVVKTCCAHRERMTVVTMTGTLKSAVRSRERGHAVTQAVTSVGHICHVCVHTYATSYVHVHRHHLMQAYICIYMYIYIYIYIYIYT